MSTRIKKIAVLILFSAALVTMLLALPHSGQDSQQPRLSSDESDVYCNLPIAVDRLDAFPATRTPGNLYPNCSFVPGDPNVFHSFLDCTLAPPGFCQIGSYYIGFSYESLPDFQTVYPWVNFIPSAGCGPNTFCEWRVDGCGPQNGCGGGGSPTPTPTVTPTPPPATGWELVAAADFDRNGYPDYALFNSATRQTAIWYLNNNFYVRGAYGPTLPSGWELVAAADFDRDGYPDYALYNSSTRQTAIWYLNNNFYARGAYGPTLPSGWELVTSADFDLNGYPDYALFNRGTGQTAIWYLNNNVYARGAYGPTLPSGWELVTSADFDLNGYPDYALFNRGTGQTAIWYLNNNVYVRGAYGPTLP